MQIFSEDLSEALDLNDKSDMLKFTGRKEEIQRLLRAAVVTAAKTFQSEQLKLKDGTVKYDGKTLTSEQEWFLKVIMSTIILVLMANQKRDLWTWL